MQTSCSDALQESKKSAIYKMREDFGKGGANQVEKKVPASSPGKLGASKPKSDMRDASTKRQRFTDGESDPKEQSQASGVNNSLGLDKSGAVVNAKADADDQHLPLLKRSRVRVEKLLSSEDRLLEGKQKHFTPGRSSLDVVSSEKDSPRDGKSRERGTSLPPKADKDRMRKAAFDGEAALPPSKRRHRALEAMSACEAEAATASATQPRESAAEPEAFSDPVGLVEPTGADLSETPKRESKSPKSRVQGTNIGSTVMSESLLESMDGAKLQKPESGVENMGNHERLETKKSHPFKDAQATSASPNKLGGVEDLNKVHSIKSEVKGKNPKSKASTPFKDPGSVLSNSPSLHGKSDAEVMPSKGYASPAPAKSILEPGTEKRKGHLTTSDSGKLGTPTSGGQDTFLSLGKPTSEDSSIKNA